MLKLVHLIGRYTIKVSKNWKYQNIEIFTRKKYQINFNGIFIKFGSHN